MDPNVIVVPERSVIFGPLIFLGGPIQGAPDWQTEAIGLIRAEDPYIFIATPRCPPPWHGDYDAQVEWEHEHLDRAAAFGVILFWCAKESVHQCERAYAQTTRFELGWSVMRAAHERAKVVVGIEDGFSNARYLRRTIHAIGYGLPLHRTLAETCRTAVLLARRWL